MSRRSLLQKMKSSVLVGARIVAPLGLDGRGMPRNVCRNHHLSSWPPIQARPCPCLSSLDLAVLSLLPFPARFATRLAPASFRSFCLSANVRGIVGRSVRETVREGRLEADGEPARTNAKGARRTRRRRTCPNGVRLGSKRQTRAELKNYF